MKHGNSQTGKLPIFRERLRSLQGDMSITAFADKLELSRQTVGFYLNGDRIPDALTLRAIADRCNVTTDYLVGKSNIPAVNPDMQNAIKYTGLSESSIQTIKALQQGKSPRGMQILNSLLSVPQFTLALIDKLLYYLICTEVFNAAKNKRVQELEKLDELTHGDIVKEIQLRESGEINITFSEHDIEEYQMQKDIAELRVVRQINTIKDILENHFADIRLCAQYGWEEDC